MVGMEMWSLYTLKSGPPGPQRGKDGIVTNWSFFSQLPTITKGMQKKFFFFFYQGNCQGFAQQCNFINEKNIYKVTERKRETKTRFLYSL
jgi:hypothetical protein